MLVHPRYHSAGFFYDLCTWGHHKAPRFAFTSWQSSLKAAILWSRYEEKICKQATQSWAEVAFVNSQMDAFRTRMARIRQIDHTLVCPFHERARIIDCNRWGGKLW